MNETIVWLNDSPICQSEVVEGLCTFRLTSNVYVYVKRTFRIARVFRLIQALAYCRKYTFAAIILIYGCMIKFVLQ